MKDKSRRSFIAKSATIISGVTLGLHQVSHAKQGFSLPGGMMPAGKRPIHAFTKVLQYLDYREMAEILAAEGFAGADLTVRAGGQVLPENVETDLPKAVKALREAGVDSYMITTNVIDADDKFTRPILKTMARLGIKYYRTGYLDYDSSKPVMQNLEGYKKSFEKLEKVNREFDVHGGYQNHSGRRVGGPVWDLYPLLKDRDPEFLGVQYDIRHATVEGAVSWPVGMKLLSPWIKTLDIKDFIWEKNEKGEWKIKNVPLGEGMVHFREFFELYKSMNIEAPVSIHYEYDLGGAEHGRMNPSVSTKEIRKWLKKDLEYLKGQFREHGL
jgi:L-ribulose-5-phosphate 3-epimerase